MSKEISHWQNRTQEHKSKIKNLLSSDKFLQTDIDPIAKKVTSEAYEKIDCLSCGNCCRTTVTTFKDEDISKASRYLLISKKEFINKYLIDDMGEWTTISTPCPFLLEDNTCKIYEARPQACESYPHTQRKDFKKKKQSHLANYDICPITFYVLERMNDLLDQK
ncbi:MAG: hypothetical protein RLZZ546_3227 [Bacteroidota bacterium]|jgi:Fe-S-cluster containining protein